jgi:hypothetical protein
MKSSRTLLATLTASALLAGASQAALTVTLHPDGLGGTVVAFSGSGTTTTAASQFTDPMTLSEQWINMTGNPFSDTLDPNNSVHMLTLPIQIAAGVFITGIEVDNDSTGPGFDEFRLFVSAAMSPNTPYSISGYSTLATPLSYEVLNVGSYTDPDDGGTAFLGDFTLVISDQVIPEPSAMALVALGGLAAVGRRRR